MSKSAFIKDKNGNLLQSNIIITEKMISIRMFDEKYELLGYMNIFFQANKRLFLSEIYCYDEYRSLGIATIISELSDYILRDYKGYILRGVYYPTQMSSDFKNINRTKEELDLRARNFYQKNGYEILSYKDFIKNKDKYGYLSAEEDFIYNGEAIDNIVFKIIKDNKYNFVEDNGVIYYNGNNKKL